MNINGVEYQVGKIGRPYEWLALVINSHLWSPSTVPPRGHKIEWVCHDHGWTSYFDGEQRQLPVLINETETIEGYTLLRITKLMDKYGWMFIDPLAMQLISGKVRVFIPDDFE